MKEREDAHKAELQKEKDEVSRLKEELQVAQSQNAEFKKAAAEEKERQEGEAQKFKDLLGQTEVRATSAQQELDTLKDKSGRWLSELTRINAEMASKFISFLFWPTQNICRHGS